MKFLPVILTVITACAAGAVPFSQNDFEKSQPEKILPIQNTRSINQAYLRPLPSDPFSGPVTTKRAGSLLSKMSSE
ncbi:hypothetical protein CCB80_11875 [Armatimonadetes bacterium Uphvl-Ar1]|nr:hypothetical protein CCB80_11875 [Armatimonadetes bacterium Uphvl-Ar1]